MKNSEIEELLGVINNVGIYNEPNSPLYAPHRCLVIPKLIWDQGKLEKILNCTLPDQLVQLWNKTYGLVLFQDVIFGQWGLVIWSPDRVLVRNPDIHEIYSEDYIQGDLIIGEFLGDSDLLVIRTDPSSEDFGTVIVALPIDKRPEWFRVSNSLGEFLTKFIENNGHKFWEPQYH